MSILDGIRVLDFGKYVAGPRCAAMLGDLGADVIRVERPGGGEDRTVVPVTPQGEGAVYLQSGRNKRSLTLNPRSPAAGDIRTRLVRSADLVVVNVPKASLSVMGLDYETLRAVRQDIILVNTSSFGPSGPWADLPGFDSIGQSMCGSAYLSGPGDTPYRTPVSWVDHATGVYAAFGAMSALYERARTGRGQCVEGSLLGSALSFSANTLIEQAASRPDRTAIGNRAFNNGPTDSFRTRDGWIVTQILGDHIFRRWAELVGATDFLEDPRFATDQLRGDNGEFLSRRMALWCLDRTSAEALGALAAAKVPSGPILSPQQALDHPQVQSLDLLRLTREKGTHQNIPVIRTPLDFSATPVNIYRDPPRAGEHTGEILAELGYSAEQITEFADNGTI